MNIGIVCYPTFGGSGVLATELGKALADKGYGIHFITYQQPVRLTGFSANIFYHEVRVPAYPLFDFPPYETALASTMVDVVKNNTVDLLHVHYAIPHASAAFMAKQILAEEKIHVPFITTLHGTDITLVGRDKTYAPVVTFSINKSDAITAVSDNLRKETLDNFDIKKEIDVIHNFVDIKRFSVKPMDAFKKAIAPNGEKIILHASNFRKIKRIGDVIYTFNKIRKSIPSKLLLVGDGPERHMAEELCRELGIFEEARFVGKQQDMEDIYAIADLFLLPSEYESFGLAALEAMAAGTPVVATNAGGIPEIITHGKNGYLSEIGNVEQMSNHAISILGNNVTLEAFSAAARKQAETFDIHNIVPKYEQLYQKVLNK
ncbi:MAG: N-acetyl-alpha-D-glucosaminyl L-malate synthase BshA [Bacteroidota bacterium]|jgi:N-acetyl-alpha-D-glucosaminyl L-malate synthase BshA|nr:N-acetyl-alpha-D-glucosaminyl L-malate synthase BshA [Chitinophagaceae bacterium]MCE2758911.1 N-acetyl-alpha-D-glucosaminyl L-malate synthase BshA [Chitinophagaceae bacterium]